MQSWNQRGTHRHVLVPNILWHSRRRVEWVFLLGSSHTAICCSESIFPHRQGARDAYNTRLQQINAGEKEARDAFYARNPGIIVESVPLFEFSTPWWSEGPRVQWDSRPSNHEIVEFTNSTTSRASIKYMDFPCRCHLAQSKIRSYFAMWPTGGWQWWQQWIWRRNISFDCHGLWLGHEPHSIAVVPYLWLVDNRAIDPCNPLLVSRDPTGTVSPMLDANI